MASTDPTDYKKRFIEWYYSTFGSDLELIVCTMATLSQEVNKNTNSEIWFPVLANKNISFNFSKRLSLRLFGSDVKRPRKENTEDYRRWRRYKRFWSFVSNNTNITGEIIDSHPTLPWDYKGLSKHIGWDYMNRHPEIKWAYKYAYETSSLPDSYRGNYSSLNPHLTLDIIESRPDKSWNFFNLSSNPHLTIDFIRKNIGEAWNWHILSGNKCITKKMVDENPDLPWDHHRVLENPSTPIEFIKEKMMRPTPWYYSLPEVAFYSAYPHRPEISIAEILSHVKDKNLIARNPNVTYEDLLDLKFSEPVWRDLSENDFLYNDVVYKRKLLECRSLRRREISPFMMDHLIKDLSNIVAEYSDYD